MYSGSLWRITLRPVMMIRVCWCSTPVSTDYKEGDNSFASKIDKVVVEVQPMTPAQAADREQG